MKIDRLIGILSILLQEEKTTAPELAERFEVSRRTVNRDIEDLCKAGIPIKTAQGTGGGISIMDGYRMDRTILSSKDMQMILAGLRSLDSVSGSRYYSQLMEKIQTGSSEFISGRDSMLIDLSSWYKGSLQRGLPFEVKMPSARPVDVSALSEAQMNAELEKGYADMQAGHTRSAKSVFADIRKDYNL